ncbi:SigE family RNA polymerase sigma factor [Virgisporangium aurantiacum]|uniref:RNA polymerase n=1 Tax=Virgisporangium aurantiacum TaxID=175570 RepID=A0A8J3ZLP4_9ACTN|nr:SigE family RNA polymerase sigma factor [Virgisporangium aurantiacum]GIJ63818.1 RNA polymerase [Virgisporangium aurantiacum]
MADSFDVFMTGRGPALLRFAYLLTGDRHLAEDLVQEALAHAHRRWSRIQRTDSPDAYVRRIVLNQFLSWRRRRSWRERVMAAPPDPTTAPSADPAEHHAARDEIWALLGTLPPQQRAVLVLRYYEDLDDAAIAAVIGCAPATVRAHASRGLSRLRELHAGSPALENGGSR